MKKVNKKVKIFIIIFIIIIAIFICINKQNYIEINSNEIIEDENKVENKILNTDIESNITIYITGAVINEGVYKINKDSRIEDAIKQAGGLKENANIKEINLAYMLEDGMKIYIPQQNENIVEDKTEGYINKEVITNENNTKNSENKIININTATQTELENLPGIGPSTALKIINYRKEKGKFKKIEDIKNVSGIGESKFSKIEKLIKV